MEKIPVIFFLGKPGSGKDTQAKLFVDEFRFFEISSGGILRALKDRAEREPENYEAQGVKKILNNAKFVPALTVASNWYRILLDIAKKVTYASHEAPNGINGIIFSGSPRKLQEAELLEDFFATWPDGHFFETKPVSIALSTTEAHKRLSAPGGRGRHDDSPKDVDSRIKEYETFVNPILDFYKERGALLSVNGEQSVEKVHEDIKKILGL